MTYSLWGNHHLFAVCTFTLGSLLLGLPGMLLPPGRRLRPSRVTQVTSAIALALVGFAALAFYLDQPLGFWLAPLLLGGLHLCLVVIRQPLLRRSVAMLLQGLGCPQVAPAFLLTTSVMISLCWLHSLFPPHVFASPPIDPGHASWMVGLEPAAEVQARTDKGQPITLMRAVKSTWNEQLFLKHQRENLQKSGLLGRVIRIGGGGMPHANCHGWVFTGGRFWIPCPEVDAILQDNGYRPVADPQPGDVVVYRYSDGNVAHTGLVWAVHGPTQVLVESKWGRTSVLLHPLLVQPYADISCAFYRTNRGSHLLAGLEKTEQKDW